MLKRFKLKTCMNGVGLIIAVLILAAFTASCSKDKEPEQKFHEVKEFTVKYDLTGARKGQKTIYSQDWGRCVTQIIENQKMISLMEDGQQYVVSIDLANNTGTKMKNPIYQQLIESLDAKTPKEFNMALLEKMGGKVVGEKTIAGNDCSQWEMMNGAQKTCITEDGIILESISNINGTESGEIVVDLKRGTTDGVDACSTGDAVIEEIDITQMLQQPEPGETPLLELKEKE